VAARDLDGEGGISPRRTVVSVYIGLFFYRYLHTFFKIVFLILQTATLRESSGAVSLSSDGPFRILYDADTEMLIIKPTPGLPHELVASLFIDKVRDKISLIGVLERRRG
jgi:hypothetical protein